MASEVLKRVMHLWTEELVFCVVGERGGIHFHMKPEQPKQGNIDGYGGIEMHSRTPQYSGQTPGDDCWLLKGKCWHDGSSLQARETWIPLQRRCNELGDYGMLWTALEREYHYRFPDTTESPP